MYLLDFYFSEQLEKRFDYKDNWNLFGKQTAGTPTAAKSLSALSWKLTLSVALRWPQGHPSQDEGLAMKY